MYWLEISMGNLMWNINHSKIQIDHIKGVYRQALLEHDL